MKAIIYCEYCGKAFDLDNQPENNMIWPCEVCSIAFCEECFSKRHGESNLRRMIDNGAYVACPDCFPKYKHEIFKQDE